MSRTWQLSLNEPWFTFVKTGRKRFEGRRWYRTVTDFRIGDTIVFKDVKATQESFRKEIVGIHHFITFEAGLEHFKAKGIMDAILPGVETVEEGTKIYYQFVSLETQLQDTICLIELD